MFSSESFAYSHSWKLIGCGTGSDSSNQQGAQVRAQRRGEQNANYLRSVQPTNIRNGKESYRALQSPSALRHSVRWRVKYGKTFNTVRLSVFKSQLGKLEDKSTRLFKRDR